MSKKLEKKKRAGMMRIEETKAAIFKALISCEIGSYTCLYAPRETVVTSTNLSELAGVSKYTARKALKALAVDGLIKYTSQGCPAIVSYGEVPELVYEARPPINGYALTEYGMKSKAFKDAYNQWCDSMETWANGDYDSDV